MSALPSSTAGSSGYPYTGEQPGQSGVISHGPAPTNIDWSYEPAASRAPIDQGCPIAAQNAGDRDVNDAAERAANSRGSPPHRESRNRSAQFIAEAAKASEGLKTRAAQGRAEPLQIAV
jgi:hypothetical protein